jgi:putative tricarboxylic transport membrane protein
MAEARTGKSVDRAAIVIGVFLLILAAITVWDARRLTMTSTYGMGPEAMPYIIAGGLALLAIGHFVFALGLVALIAGIGFGAGFIPAMALLFAATARAFGRTAIVTDLVIGLVLAFVVYLMFTKLLTLALPEGPLERLL